MSTKMPPVPPANRTDKGEGGTAEPTRDTTPHGQQRPTNPDQQDQEANTRINTTHDGGRQAR